jgi:hypothetical protein
MATGSLNRTTGGVAGRRIVNGSPKRRRQRSKYSTGCVTNQRPWSIAGRRGPAGSIPAIVDAAAWVI